MNGNKAFVKIHSSYAPNQGSFSSDFSLINCVAGLPVTSFLLKAAPYLSSCFSRDVSLSLYKRERKYSCIQHVLTDLGGQCCH